MNANSRKWAGRTLFWPVFMLFVVLSPVFSPPRTAFGFPTSDLGHPLQPSCDSFSVVSVKFSKLVEPAFLGYKV